MALIRTGGGNDMPHKLVTSDITGKTMTYKGDYVAIYAESAGGTYSEYVVVYENNHKSYGSGYGTAVDTTNKTILINGSTPTTTVYIIGDVTIPA